MLQHVCVSQLSIPMENTWDKWIYEQKRLIFSPHGSYPWFIGLIAVSLSGGRALCWYCVVEIIQLMEGQQGERGEILHDNTLPVA